MKFSLFFALFSLVISDCFGVKDWWEQGNFYQVYPRSFKDSDGDGVGDLKGITEKLLYIKEIGMTGVWLSPIYKSPMADFGYDISNFTDIHYEYGTMDDFVALARRCKLLGLKLILDFVPNHTSDESIWFKLSELKDPYYKDFYVWHPGKYNNETQKYDPPSNWNSLFRYSMWQWSDIRQEYYLHQCIVKQPDLNYRNPNVVKEMNNVLLFWLDKGVDGFRIDAIPHIFEKVNDDGSYPDEPISGKTNDTTAIDYTTREYTRDLPETYELVYSWRELMDQYKKQHGGTTKILMTEAYAPLEKQMLYYGDSSGRRGSEVPFNFAMIDNINVNSTPADYKSAIDSWLNNMPKGDGFVPNWVVGNHDNKRVVNRFGMNRGDAINMLVQMLPGIAITYNGEELVMTDKWLSFEDTVDPQGCNQGEENYDKLSRDPARTPFQWDDSKGAGFSTSYRTWLPVNDDYQTINVKKERLDPKSHLNTFKRLVRMRKLKRVVQDGDLVTVAIDNLLILKREIGLTQLFVVLNLGSADQSFKIEDVFSTYKKLFIATVVSDNAGITRGKLFRTNKAITIPKDAGIILE